MVISNSLLAKRKSPEKEVKKIFAVSGVMK